VPAAPVVGIPVQVSWSASGAGPTVNVPLQAADLPLQFPEFADTDMPLYVPISGLLQSGALVQLRPLLTAMSLQATVGGLIAVPAMPDEGTAVQVSVKLEPLLELIRSQELLELESWVLLLPPPPPSPPDEQENMKAKASEILAINRTDFRRKEGKINDILEAN